MTWVTAINMRAISNDRYDAIIRLLTSFTDEKVLSLTQEAERRRKAMKMLKYLKMKKQ